MSPPGTSDEDREVPIGGDDEAVPPAGRERFTVPAALAGERLDRAVALVTGRARTEVVRLVDMDGVLLGGEVARQRSRRLAEGDVVELELWRLPEEREPAVPAPPGAVPFLVVHEDPDLVVVDKPAGVVTHPGAGRREGTLVSGLLARFPELALLPLQGCGSPERPGIVHRLDRETSGLLAVARSAAGFRSLTSQLANRTLGRGYRALVAGHVGPAHGLIDAPIGRSSRDRTRMAAIGDGRAARTNYDVVRRFTEPVAATELAVRLDTGRTHQIRVHLAAIGHPVLGDGMYGGRKSASGVTRLMLHAERLHLVHPCTGEEMIFEAGPPEEFRATLERFVEDG